MTKFQDINRANYHEYYYHVIDKEKYDDYYPETIDINEPVKRSLLDPDGKIIGTNYKKEINYIREGFDAYVKSRNIHWFANEVKLYFTGNKELDNKLKNLNIKLYNIDNKEVLKEEWDNIKEDSTFQGIKDTSDKNPHPTNRTLDFERLNETNVGKILCHIATIPTYNIFMKEMKNINDKEKLLNEFVEYTKDLKIDHTDNYLVNKLSGMILENYTGGNAGKRKNRGNRKSKKSKKGKRSRKARKSRRKSNRRRRR